MYKLALVEALDREEQVREDLYKLALVKALDREEQVIQELYKLALVKLKAPDGEEERSHPHR